MSLPNRLLLATSFAGALSGAAIAADQPHLLDIPAITVVGFAHEWHVPDEATTTAVMIGSGSTADAAITDLEPLTAKATALLKQAGIAEDATSSSGPDIEPLYKRFYDAQGREIMERREPNGFRATFRLTFKTKDIAAVGKLIPQLTAAKATIEGVSFALSNYREVEEALEERAVADAVARAKRQIIAAGAKPGRILAIGEQSTSFQTPKAPVMRAFAAAPLAAVAKDFTFALRPGKEDISAERPVTLEILSE